MNKNNKGKRWLKDHAQSQILDGNTMRRITKSQNQEMRNLVAKLENIQFYGDEDSGELKGEMVNYALYSSISNFILNAILVESSYYEEVSSNGVWMLAMKD